MLDIKYIKENPAHVKELLLRKGADCSAEIDRILALDLSRRETIGGVENDKAEQNKVSKKNPRDEKSRTGYV
ncbi:hypothetical protein FACS1894219_05080 [Clostridia bacterium]|nr:hypothetical protein FACS1894219_05080 [Clostridia bacterium]